MESTARHRQEALRCALTVGHRRADGQPTEATDVVERASSVMPKLVVVAVVMTVYAQAYLRDYAWGDDYLVLASATGRGGPSIVDHVIAGGRPLLAPILLLSFGLAQSIDGLWLLRLCGTFGVALCGLVALAALTRSGLDRRLALPTSLAVCLLPTFHGPAAWATPWEVGYVAALAGAAGLLIVDATSRPARQHRKLLLAGLALMVSFLVYQPATMFVWFPIAADLVTPRTEWSVARRRLIRQIASVATPVAVAAIVAASVVAVTAVQPLQRTALLTPPALLEKATWFLTRLVVTGARPFVASKPTAVEAAVTALPLLALMASGLFLRARGTTRQRFALPAAAFVVVTASATPNLIVGENQFEFRVLIGLAPVMLLLLVVAIEQLWVSSGGVYARSVVLAGAWLVVAVAAGSAARLVDDLFIAPSVADERYFAQRLQEFDPSRYERIVVVVPASWPRRQRLGSYSLASNLSRAGVAEPLTHFVLEKRGVAWPLSQVEQVATRPRPDERVFVLDTAGRRDEVCAEVGARCRGALAGRSG